MLYSVMRPVLLLLLLAAVCAAKKKSSRYASEEGGDKQGKVVELFTGLAKDDIKEPVHVYKPFPYSDNQLYTNAEAVKNFTTEWKEGFLDKYGVFTMACKRTNRQTASLFHIFYFAKDFDTFYKVASWAKGEIHPEMYVFALMSAVITRKDTATVTLPPMFEVLPNYFVPSTVINQAYRAQLNGVPHRQFKINNTGWEWDWHNGWGMESVLAVQQTERKSFDVENRLSYYREDVSRIDFILKYYLMYSASLTGTVRDSTEASRLGEIRFTLLHWLLTRYNLERYAVGLPRVRPIDLNMPIETGYDPQMIDVYGRPIPGRPDYITPEEVDPMGSNVLHKIIQRFQESIEGTTFFTDEEHQKQFPMTINVVGDKVVKGDSGLYPSLYYNYLALVDGLVSTTNEFEYSAGALLNSFTTMRDPAHYQILAYINQLYETMNSELKPYTKEDLSFPGVTIKDIDVTKLETFFEYFDFDISNAVPGQGKGEYIASQFRINHKPFTVTLKINSDKKVDGIVKIFLGPATDHANRTLGLNQMRESFVFFDSFPVKLQSGENVFKRDPSQTVVSDELKRMKDLHHAESGDRHWQIIHPKNLVLPKGCESGKPYRLYVVVHPYGGSDITEFEKHSTHFKNHLFQDTAHTIMFPVDRHWVHQYVEQPNHKFMDTFIYHTDVTSSKRA